MSAARDYEVRAENPDGRQSSAAAPRFEFDADAARAALAVAAAHGDDPWLSSESPGRAIDHLFYDLTVHMTCPPGYDRYDLGLYPLIYDYDPDGLLLVVRRPTPLPALADGPWDWDDLAPRHALDRALTADEATGIVTAIVQYANDLLASADHHPGQ